MTPKLSSRRRTGSKRGFTLVEIMLVCVIIGIMAMLSYPLIARNRSNAAGARFINDLRQAVHAFELQALQTGYYPLDSGPGIMPPGMEDVLRRPMWDRETPIGGTWDWAVDQDGIYASVRVVSPTFSPSMLQVIDLRFDDGDLSTGSFQSIGDDVAYIIE